MYTSYFCIQNLCNACAGADLEACINNACCVTTEGSGLKGRFLPRTQCGTRSRDCRITDCQKTCFYCVTALVKHLKHVLLAVTINRGDYLSPASPSSACFWFLQSLFCKMCDCHFPDFATCFLKVIQVFVKPNNSKTRLLAKTLKIVSDNCPTLCPTLQLPT